MFGYLCFELEVERLKFDVRCYILLLYIIYYILLYIYYITIISYTILFLPFPSPLIYLLFPSPLLFLSSSQSIFLPLLFHSPVPNLSPSSLPLLFLSYPHLLSLLIHSILVGTYIRLFILYYSIPIFLPSIPFLSLLPIILIQSIRVGI